MTQDKPQEVMLKLRNLTVDDIPELEALMDRVYDDIGGSWPRQSLEMLINEFPEGQITIEDKGQLVAAALAVRCSHGRFTRQHTYEDLLGRREVFRHDESGDALYGLDLFVHPDYRHYRLGRRLYDARKELCVQLNLRSIIAGGRIVNYHEYAENMSPEQYIKSVKQREAYDPILSFQLANDFQVLRILRNYLPEDERSRGFATLLEWSNIVYEPEELQAAKFRKKCVRVSIVQWQMRSTQSFEEWLDQVEYFVDSMADYTADFVLFPEFFNAPLMSLGDQKNQYEAIRFLAGFAQQTIDAISNFAVSYNINIIAGSLPVLEGNTLYNNAYLFRRDGSHEVQPKIHITPHEQRDWVIKGGKSLRAFDTDAGRIGILICYDVEFPELPRLLRQMGIDILFVPFWTDTKNGFLRVQRCAQARAIENEIYVAIGGSVGNLPQVHNVDIQYAQSAVYSPSDFAFPHDAVMAESTPNTEMALIADLDLELLNDLRLEGSVTNGKDQRKDLYTLKWLGD
jgi:predicted amidohydrolase/GNAT superfamily N-acetyltransferase